MNPPLTIATAADLEALCRRVAGSARVGLDTEFHNERSYAARLMVVQIAFEDGAAIVDPLAVRDLRPLCDALSRTTVVGHALSSDLKIFADRFGVVPPEVFDCQVAASFLGYGMAISLADLVRDVVGVRLKKSQTVSDWSMRPLTEKQIEYLVDDVAHLLPMHDALLARLRELGRESWALEECRLLGDPERYRTEERRLYAKIPGSNRMNRRELGILAEIVRWRDELARERDVPAKYILPDDVVGGLAVLRPKAAEDLVQLRRLDAGARRSLGPAILGAVARGEALTDDELPERFSRPLGPSRETLVALMSVVAGEIARANDLPASLIVPRSVLERAARELPGTQDEFERALGLSSWRLGLVSAPLWRLLSGESSLRIQGYADGEPRITVSDDDEQL